MKRIKREDEEGAMGVGTLIVFIAMVLVAAVAASVLIDTANKLQQQAQKTGEQAIREVSTSFTVLDVYGKDTETDPDGEIEELYIKLGLAAGAPAQDLNQTVIQIKNDTFEQNLQYSSSFGTGSADGTHYTVSEAIIEQEGTSGYDYLEQGDKILIKIDLSAVAGGGEAGIGTQENIDLEIMPKHGTPTYEMITTPPVIAHEHVDLT